MASPLVINSSTVGNSLQALLTANDILPGDEPSYELCKTIYLFHPLGQKMAEAPIKMAQFLPRDIAISAGPGDDLLQAFNEQWERDGYTSIIRNVATQARIYGIASVALIDREGNESTPLDPNRLATDDITFSVFDPLNTAGSLVLNQNPNAFDFQKYQHIRVGGKLYHRSKTVTLMNEQPIYIAYSSSAYGFSGRSVYQRALYPLKSFIRTMIADDMVARKVGVIVASLKMVGSVVDQIMATAARFKRQLLKVAETDNVISVNTDETVTSLDLTNIDGPLSTARKHILENIAAAADMPAKLLNAETFAEGFGEGTEDAKSVAAYVDEIRSWMNELYRFFDKICMHRAWNENFYKSLKTKYKSNDALGGSNYKECFYAWKNGFRPSWPSLLREPESEQVRVEDTKLKAVIAMAQVLIPELDPENKASLLQGLYDTFNNSKKLFPIPFVFDKEAFEEYTPPEPVAGVEGGDKEPGAAPPFSARDSASLAAYMGREDTSEISHRIARIEDYVRRKIK